MNPFLEIAYRTDPVLWAIHVLGITPHEWQKPFLGAARGAAILALTSRQVGKTTAAAIGMAHTAVFKPGSLSVVACPAQRQSAEAIRKVRDMVLKAGATLTSDNVYGLELDNGSRVLALPGSDDSVRGLTVDGWIVADEAARLSSGLIAALRPMRARCPQARLVMLSTAWSRTDQFWLAWSSDDLFWTKIKATVDMYPDLIPAAFLEAERRQGDDYYKREYLGIPSGGHVSPFTFELYEHATRTPVHRNTWDFFKPTIIAHDVGRTKDRSTAVVGGTSPLAPGLVGIKEFEELQQGLYGSARANELATVDRRYDGKTLIIADLSNDATYAEPLFERLGRRLIGVQISRHGDGMTPEWWPVKNGGVWVYTVGRTYLLDLLHTQLRNDGVRILHGPNALRAYEQLMTLEIELRESGLVYRCPPGQHDDLAISSALLVWAARHPHLYRWCWALEGPRPPRNKQRPPNALGWT